MGCAICLDGFAQDASEEQRPAALSCGHLFHHECLLQWQQNSARSRKNKEHVCSLCKATTPHDRLVKLYPTEGDDLDRYLANQNIEIDDRLVARSVVPAAASVAPEDKDDDVQEVVDGNLVATRRDQEEAKRLLNSLLDLNQHLQSWVMAVHGVRIDTVMRSGTRIKRLVADLSGEERLAQNGKEDLEKSFSSLEEAVKSLDKRRKALEEYHQVLHQKRKELNAKSLALQQQARLVRAKRDSVVSAADEVRVQQQSLQVAIEKAEASFKEQQAREATLEERAEKLETQARELEAQRRQMRLETAQKIRTMELAMQEITANAADQAAEAVNKEREAVQERDAVVQKNNMLAEQLRHLHNEYKKVKMKLDKRAEAAREADKAKRELAEAQRILKRHKSHAEARQMPKRDGISFTSSSSSSLTAKEGVKGTDSPVTPSDRAALSVAKSKGGKLPSSTLLVEGEDLDDELLQDSLYPMPGLDASSVRAHRMPFGPSHSANAIDSASLAPATPLAKGPKPHTESPQNGSACRPKAVHVAPSACSHQRSIRFHRSSSDGAVHLGGQSGGGDGVIDLTSSPPGGMVAEEDKENGQGSNVGYNHLQQQQKLTGGPDVGGGADKGRGYVEQLYSWLGNQNGVVLGPKRKRR